MFANWSTNAKGFGGAALAIGVSAITFFGGKQNKAGHNLVLSYLRSTSFLFVLLFFTLLCSSLLSALCSLLSALFVFLCSVSLSSHVLTSMFLSLHIHCI